MDRFADILFELGKEIGTELVPDQNRICQLNYMDELHIQLQYDDGKESILIAAFLCDVPPGKYREKLFKEALKSNGDYPRIGTLAYSERNNQLTLFETIPAVELKSDRLFKILQEFIAKANVWKDAIKNGKPLPTASGEINSNDTPFGLKP